MKRYAFAVILGLMACSRDAAIRNTVDAARAVCCLSHIRQGTTPKAAEAACATVEAVAPYIAPTENLAQEVKPNDAGTTDRD